VQADAAKRILATDYYAFGAAKLAYIKLCFALLFNDFVNASLSVLFDNNKLATTHPPTPLFHLTN
jgi:hypothetical protein